MNKRNFSLGAILLIIVATILIGCSVRANASTEIEADAPTFLDRCGVQRDRTIMPADTELLDYTKTRIEEYEGEYVWAKWHVVTVALTPYAVEQGYVLVGRTSWDHVYDDYPCANPDRSLGVATMATKKCVRGDRVKITYYENGEVVKVRFFKARKGEC